MELKEILPYILGWLIPTVLAGAWGYTRGKLKAVTSREKAMEDGLCAVLLMELTDAFKLYVVEGQPMSFDRKRALEQVANAYFALGGNGVGKQMWDELVDVVPSVLVKKEEQ